MIFLRMFSAADRVSLQLLDRRKIMAVGLLIV